MDYPRTDALIRMYVGSQSIDTCNITTKIIMIIFKAQYKMTSQIKLT